MEDTNRFRRCHEKCSQAAHCKNGIRTHACLGIFLGLLSPFEAWQEAWRREGVEKHFMSCPASKIPTQLLVPLIFPFLAFLEGVRRRVFANNFWGKSGQLSCRFGGQRATMMVTLNVTTYKGKVSKLTCGLQIQMQGV